MDTYNEAAALDRVTRWGETPIDSCAVERAEHRLERALLGYLDAVDEAEGE